MAIVSALQAFASASLYDRWFTPPGMDMPTLRAENAQLQEVLARSALSHASVPRLRCGLRWRLLEFSQSYDQDRSELTRTLADVASQAATLAFRFHHEHGEVLYEHVKSTGADAK